MPYIPSVSVLYPEGIATYHSLSTSTAQTFYDRDNPGHSSSLLDDIIMCQYLQRIRLAWINEWLDTNCC